MSANAQANWRDLPVELLSAEAQVAYSEYKDAQRKAAALREVFERLASDQLAPPAGMRAVFGYRFGKLSCAIVDDDRKAKPKATATQSLADWMAQQQASGRAA